MMPTQCLLPREPSRKHGFALEQARGQKKLAVGLLSVQPGCLLWFVLSAFEPLPLD